MGSGFTDDSSLILVLFGDVLCDVTSASSDEVTCVLEEGTAGQKQIFLQVISGVFPLPFAFLPHMTLVHETTLQKFMQLIMYGCNSPAKSNKIAYERVCTHYHIYPYILRLSHATKLHRFLTKSCDYHVLFSRLSMVMVELQSLMIQLFPWSTQ